MYVFWQKAFDGDMPKNNTVLRQCGCDEGQMTVTTMLVWLQAQVFRRHDVAIVQ